MTCLKRNIRVPHLVLAGWLLALGLSLWTCEAISKKETRLSGIVHPSGQEFAGSETCASCHGDVVASHLETAHYLTSQTASSETVKGNFDSGSNTFVLNQRLRIVMEEDSGRLYQRAVIDGRSMERKPFDVTIGSGRNGQTYLFWDGQSLAQLPVSYYAPAKSWCNSPGYPADQILFNRYVPARCLECHTTFARIGKTVAGRETFNREHLITGVDCERCHGPAADHVLFHQKNPHEKEGRHIVNPATLTRQQRLDNCALCHSGIRENFLPSFSFTVGGRLEDFFFPPEQGGAGRQLDVHGNQYGLLAASKCFQNSDMDCSSCHNVHRRESGKPELFSDRCMNCHRPGGENFCRQSTLSEETLAANCIDCHMPALPSNKVFMQSPDSARPTPFLIRTHLVATYEEEILRVLDRMKEGSDH